MLQIKLFQQMNIYMVEKTLLIPLSAAICLGYLSKFISVSTSFLYLLWSNFLHKKYEEKNELEYGESEGIEHDGMEIWYVPSFEFFELELDGLYPITSKILKLYSSQFQRGVGEVWLNQYKFPFHHKFIMYPANGAIVIFHCACCSTSKYWENY